MTARDTSWAAFLRMARPALVLDGFTLCLDPGETTGWALFKGLDLVEAGQWATPQPDNLSDEIHLLEVVRKLNLERIVYEEYRVRGNKYKEHVGSEVVTIQHIGAIKVVAKDLSVETFKQGAGMAKGFATDTKLRRWGLYQVGMRHANDAIRHGVYWILFASGKSDPRHRHMDTDTG